MLRELPAIPVWWLVSPHSAGHKLYIVHLIQQLWLLNTFANSVLPNRDQEEMQWFREAVNGFDHFGETFKVYSIKFKLKILVAGYYLEIVAV